MPRRMLEDVLYELDPFFLQGPPTREVNDSWEKCGNLLRVPTTIAALHGRILCFLHFLQFWYEACDIEANFTQLPYNSASPRVVVTLSSQPRASGCDSIARAVINSTLKALPGWYRLDHFVRQLSFEQRVPGAAPLMPSFVES